jgi:hypothetical protein
VAPFELDRREPIGMPVTPHRVVEHLYVLEHILPGRVAFGVDAAPNALPFEQMEEAVGRRGAAAGKAG